MAFVAKLIYLTHRFYFCVLYLLTDIYYGSSETSMPHPLILSHCLPVYMQHILAHRCNDLKKRKGTAIILDVEAKSTKKKENEKIIQNWIKVTKTRTIRLQLYTDMAVCVVYMDVCMFVCVHFVIIKYTLIIHRSDTDGFSINCIICNVTIDNWSFHFDFFLSFVRSAFF